jgi:hypothetical protein
MNTFIKMLTKTDITITKIYVFQDKKFQYISEILERVKPEYSFSTKQWGSYKITEKEFKEIEKYLKLKNLIVLPKEPGISILFYDYDFGG